MTTMAANGTSDAGGPVSKYETEEGLKEVASFLRGRNGMPLRPAIEMDRRVEYFKGESAAHQTMFCFCKCAVCDIFVCIWSVCIGAYLNTGSTPIQNERKQPALRWFGACDVLLESCRRKNLAPQELNRGGGKHRRPFQSVSSKLRAVHLHCRYTMLAPQRYK